MCALFELNKKNLEYEINESFSFERVLNRKAKHDKQNEEVTVLFRIIPVGTWKVNKSAAIAMCATF